MIHFLKDFPDGTNGGEKKKKNLPAYLGDTKDGIFELWIRKIPWKRKWQPTPVFLSGKSHGQKSLAGCSPWGHRVGLCALMVRVVKER